MIKYFVRTTGKRKLDKSYSQIEYELLIDRENKPLKSLISQYYYISAYDSVLLEDDLILCEDFKTRIEDVINNNPDKIINFFFLPRVYNVNNEKFNDNFHFSQCRYYPKGITDKIANNLNKKHLLNAPKTARYVTAACNDLGYKIMHYRPCLVQHIDNESLIGNIPKSRRTPFFVDYLDELNITYEQARSKENTQRLYDIMKRHFEDINKK